MNNTENKIIKLQPRQLYDILMAYQRSGCVCLRTEHISEFGVYKDSESVTCAINDFYNIRQNTKGTIEITFEPLKQKNRNEKHIPYLHEVCQNNTYFAHTLGLDGVKNVTFSDLIKNPSELLRKHTEIMCEAVVNIANSYEILDLTKNTEILPLIELLSKKEKIALIERAIY